MNPPIPWRRRLSELGRNLGKPHAPLFAPLLYGVASQIEALPPAEVSADPTRLGKCLVELRRALGTTPLTVSAPTAMEAEALGATVNRDTWPPRVEAPVIESVMESVFGLADFEDVWSRSEALSASLETCRRLSSTLAGEPVLLAGLTGPAALLAQLLDAPPSAEAWEFAGRALSALARQYAQAGASGLLICEPRAPADIAGWSSALNTLSNIARFHRIPLLLAFDVGVDDHADDRAGVLPPPWPTAAVACPAIASGDVLDARAHGACASADPSTWAELPSWIGAARVVVTAREVAADTDIEVLTEACEAAREIEREV